MGISRNDFLSSPPYLHHSGSIRFEVELVKRAILYYEENHLSICVQLTVEFKNKYRKFSVH